MEITKIFKFHMGHRVPNHKSKCRAIHGHTYFCHVTIKGKVNSDKGSSDEGMVMDFSDMKEIVNNVIENKLDHAFMVYDKDELKNYLQSASIDKKLFDIEKIFVVDFIPTAENIAVWLFDELDKNFTDFYKEGGLLKRITLYETPTSYVVYEK